MRKKIVAGNWKMNNDLQAGLKLFSEITNMAIDELKGEVKVVIAPPFIHLSQFYKLIDGTKIALAAQNCSSKKDGAYTGEVSAAMLKSVHCKYVIVGHSERRSYYNEKNTEIAGKIDQILENDMRAIFCCGETLDQRNSGKHIDIVKSQVSESLFHLNKNQIENIVVAYEPVWAIGTGVTASADQAQEMHKMIRDHIYQKFGKDVSDNVSILYGGSVKPNNAKELFSCADIDGGLIGGASLQSRDFMDIVKAV